jgi:hypothetical protein
LNKRRNPPFPVSILSVRPLALFGLLDGITRDRETVDQEFFKSLDNEEKDWLFSALLAHIDSGALSDDLARSLDPDQEVTLNHVLVSNFWLVVRLAGLEEKILPELKKTFPSPSKPE